MITCSYFHEYKALRKPTCGCEGCKRKWDMATTIPINFDSFSLQESGNNLWWTFVCREYCFYIEHWDYKGTDQSYVVVMFGPNNDHCGFESDDWLSVLGWLKSKRLEYDKVIRL